MSYNIKEVEDFRKFQKRFIEMEEKYWPAVKTYPAQKIEDNYGEKSSCLHDNCSSCGGTGQKKNGLGACIHMISCPCPKCSPVFL